MYFDLTEDQKSIRHLLEGFFADRFAAAQGVDTIRETVLAADLWRDIAELGMFGILLDEAQGGLGLDLLTLAVVAEVLGHYAVPAPVVASVLAVWVIGATGDTGQKERWLEPLLRGKAVAAFAFPEDGDGAEQLASGRSAFVERGADADLFILIGGDGGLALLDPAQAQCAREPIDTLDRTRPLVDLQWDGACVDPLGGNTEVPERLHDAFLILYAADALGAAFGAQARAVAYARERRQFGRPIGSFQALKHQLADMSVELEPSRPLVWYAAHAWDTRRPDASRMAAIAKAHVGDIAVQVTRNAIEAHGGIGYTWEYPLHLFLKRAMHDRQIMGNPTRQRIRAARMAGW